MGLAHQLYLGIALGTWHEVVDIDKRLFAADTVHTAYALHQTCGVPGRIVVQNDIGTVKVHTLCQNLCGDDDVVVVLPGPFVIGIEVLLDRMLHLVTVGSGDDKRLIAFRLYRSCKRLDCIYGFREDDQLP